jgi:hypothetical protein
MFDPVSGLFMGLYIGVYVVSIIILIVYANRNLDE